MPLPWWSLLLTKGEILVNVVSVGVDCSDPYRLMDAIAEQSGPPAHLPRAGLPPEMGSGAAFLASRRNSYMRVAWSGISAVRAASRGPPRQLQNAVPIGIQYAYKQREKLPPELRGGRSMGRAGDDSERSDEEESRT